MKIAVAGATGRAGRHVVDLLQTEGHEAVPISRSQGVDIITGEGLEAALAGVDTIIDLATGPSPEEQPATEFFTTATRNLQEVGVQAGVKRIVVASIVGTDRFDSGYGVAKVAHERAMLAGPIPALILRATQFHEFVAQLTDWGLQGDVAYVPRMRTQLVASRTVAQALIDRATGPGNGSTITEIAGPREESLVEAAKLLAAHRGTPARIEGVSAPDEAYESGGLLPGPDATLAGPTFEEWLRSAA
jgi:uncharacterized protein YbjT (DUF2867 family)